MDHTPTDRELMHRIRNQESTAFKILHARYENQLRKYLVNMIRDAASSDDILQETFLRIWKNSDKWEDRGTFKSWIYRIATNLALNFIRSRKRRREKPMERDLAPMDIDEDSLAPSWMIDESSLGPDKLTERIEQKRILHGLVENLPERKRDVIRLVYNDEMDISEAAEILNVPEGTVKSRLHYAQRDLAREWRKLESLPDQSDKE